MAGTVGHGYDKTVRCPRRPPKGTSVPSRLPIAHLCLGVLYAVLMVLAVSPGENVAEVARVVFGLIGLAAAAWAARDRGPAHRAWLAVTFFPWGGLALGGAALSALVLFRQALVQRESDEQAVTDHLTGLSNRSLFRVTDTRSLARAARTGKYSAVLVIDMNGFKEVNDTLGHKSGDLVLVEFAELLRRCVPAPGLPCRLGGDEFAVVLPDLDNPEQAYEVAGRIAAEVSPVVVDGKIIAMAASVGVAVSAPGELTHDEIVHRADQAMYRAKRSAPHTRWAAWQESFEQPVVELRAA